MTRQTSTEGYRHLQSQSPSGVSSVTFTSAGSDEAWSNFKNLILVGKYAHTSTSTAVPSFLQLNGSTTNHDEVWHIRRGATSDSKFGYYSEARTAPPGAYMAYPPGNQGAWANEFAFVHLNIGDINNTNAYKRASHETGFSSTTAATSYYVWHSLGSVMVRDTSALTEFTISFSSYNFTAGSYFDLTGGV